LFVLAFALHYCPFLLSVVCLMLEVPGGGQSSCWVFTGLGGGHDAAAALSTLTVRTLLRLLYLDNRDHSNLNSGLVSFGGFIAGEEEEEDDDTLS